MSEIYEEIFTGVDVRQAIARAVRTLREALEKEDNRAVTAAHVRNLADIDPQALATAFALAEKTCTYWPTPGQIRELAGWSEESRSREALQWVFTYLANHGVDGRPRGGGVRFGEDETGRRVLLGSEVLGGRTLTAMRPHGPRRGSKRNGFAVRYTQGESLDGGLRDDADCQDGTLFDELHVPARDTT
jgi:hypothetical protein